MLCVDDEPLVLEGLRDVLSRGFDVRVAESGREALELLEHDHDGYAVVLSDMRMPGMSGASFLAEAKRIAPLAVRMLLTGHADTESAVRAVNDGQIFRFLTKPCDRGELYGACTAAVQQHRLMAAERVLVEQAVDGGIRALRDVLALTAPAMLGQEARLEPGGDRHGPLDESDSAGTPAAAPMPEAERTMTLGEAAEALGLSTSTLRRWADANRIRAIRTSGGHRRFPAREVQRLSAAQHKPVVVRTVTPPVEPLPALSELLTTVAPDLAIAAAHALYEGAHTGWFASPTGRQHIERWTLGVAAGARTGDYDAATDATRRLMVKATHVGTSLVERYTLLERVGAIVMRDLEASDTDHFQLMGARRLLLCLRQVALEADGG